MRTGNLLKAAENDGKSSVTTLHGRTFLKTPSDLCLFTEEIRILSSVKIMSVTIKHLCLFIAKENKIQKLRSTMSAESNY